MATTARTVEDVKPRQSSAERTPEQIRRFLVVELLSAKTEPEKAVLRCALNLLRGVQAFEIDQVTGLACTVDGFEASAARWTEEHAWYDRGDDPDTNWFRHQRALEGRAVQAKFATIHPQLAEPQLFPDHGPRSCAFCLMAANRAAGLPWDTGIDPATGGIAAPGLEGAA